MSIADILVLAMILGILGSVGLFLRKQKKKGVKCIGCSDSGSCPAGGCSGKCPGCNGSCQKN